MFHDTGCKCGGSTLDEHHSIIATGFPPHVYSSGGSYGPEFEKAVKRANERGAFCGYGDNEKHDVTTCPGFHS